jgi:hypothetical protein
VGADVTDKNLPIFCTEDEYQVPLKVWHPSPRQHGIMTQGTMILTVSSILLSKMTLWVISDHTEIDCFLKTKILFVKL